MPYDPRPESEGGNSSIDEPLSRKVPDGKVRVIGVDTFDGSDWHEGDFDSLALARAHMAKKLEGQQMTKMHVYDSKGKHLHEGGEF